MQLHTTQWLPDYWNKSDISFPCFSGQGTDPQLLNPEVKAIEFCFSSDPKPRLINGLLKSIFPTQWLPDYWNKSDISFPCFSDGKIDFNNPLIKRGFYSS
jgi:hypothetical protein